MPTARVDIILYIADRNDSRQISLLMNTCCELFSWSKFLMQARSEFSKGRYPTTPVTMAAVSKKLEKYCHAPWKAQTRFGWLEERVPPLEYARGAGKIEEKIAGGGTPSFITGQPGILVEMTGVKQGSHFGKSDVH